MNNKERMINEFNDPVNFVKLVKKIAELDDSVMNWEEWFKSEDPFPTWKGEKGMYCDHSSDKVECYIVEKVKRFNADYLRIIIPSGKDFFDPEFSFQRLTVPSIYVERN